MSSSATTCLWKLFRRSRTPFRDRSETVRLHPGTDVRLHPGILFEIIPEHRSESSRNRVHLAPDSSAIAFYLDHKPEIDRYLQETEREFEANAIPLEQADPALWQKIEQAKSKIGERSA